MKGETPNLKGKSGSREEESREKISPQEMRRIGEHWWHWYGLILLLPRWVRSRDRLSTWAGEKGLVGLQGGPNEAEWPCFTSESFSPAGGSWRLQLLGKEGGVCSDVYEELWGAGVVWNRGRSMRGRAGNWGSSAIPRKYGRNGRAKAAGEGALVWRLHCDLFQLATLMTASERVCESLFPWCSVVVQVGA